VLPSRNIGVMVVVGRCILCRHTSEQMSLRTIQQKG